MLSFWVTDRDRYRNIKEGFRLPWGYGMVMYDPAMRATLVARMPWNWVLGFGWWLFWRLRDKEWNKELYHAYELGLMDGKANRQRQEINEAFIEQLRRLN